MWGLSLHASPDSGFQEASIEFHEGSMESRGASMTSMEPTEHPSALWSVHSPRESLQNVHDSPGADGVSPL